MCVAGSLKLKDVKVKSIDYKCTLEFSITTNCSSHFSFETSKNPLISTKYSCVKCDEYELECIDYTWYRTNCSEDKQSGSQSNGSCKVTCPLGDARKHPLIYSCFQFVIESISTESNKRMVRNKLGNYIHFFDLSSKYE